MGRTAACDVKCQKQRQYKVQNIQPEYVKAQDSAVRIEKDRNKQRPCKESQKRGGQKCVGRIFQESRAEMVYSSTGKKTSFMCSQADSFTGLNSPTAGLLPDH